MKKSLLILISLFTLLFLTSCDSTFELIPQNSKAIKMTRNKAVLITTANNGYYKTKQYRSSGKKTTRALETKLYPYASTVSVSPETSFSKIDRNTLLDYDYVISPELYHWEDRATCLSFMPDKIILGLTVYDNTGNILNHIEIKGESTKATGVFNDPIDLIDEALDIYIRQLFELN